MRFLEDTANSDIAQPSHLLCYMQGYTNNAQTNPSCQVVACHACRPYFKDRISMSFDAVFNDEVCPLHLAEAEVLPVKSARIFQNISCRPILAPLRTPMDEKTPSTVLIDSAFSHEESCMPSQSSIYTYKTTQSEIDTLNTTHRLRRRFYKMGHRSSGELGRDLSRQMPVLFRQGLKDAFKGMFRATARDSSSSGSNITLPMPHTAAARDSTDSHTVGEFDMGALRRMKRQKDRFDLRRESKYGAGATRHDDRNCALGQRLSSTSTSDEASSSSSSDISVYSCVSEGSEVAVEGGVALTGEAVETHTPDITSEMESIMAQV